MFVELRTQRAIPGKLDSLISYVGGSMRSAAEENGARLLFASVGDSGPLNEVVSAWQFPSLAIYEKMQSALRSDSKWIVESQDAKSNISLERRQMLETTDFTKVAIAPSGTRLIDLRIYSFKPHGLREFLPVCKSDGLPGQLRHCGALVFHGVSISGQEGQLIQAWAYRDHAQYEAGQKSLFVDPDWAQGYRQRVIHLVDMQEHRYLNTLNFSPVDEANTWR